MTLEKVRRVVAFYRHFLDKAGIKPKQCEHELRLPVYGDSIILGHCRWMCDEIEEFIRAGRTQKAMRWLGFVQGALWAAGLFTISELKDHNKPDEVDRAC